MAQGFVYRSSDPTTGSYVSVGCLQRSRVALNPFPTSLLDFFPCGGKIEVFTNFLRHTTSLRALRVMPSHPGGMTSKSNNRHEIFHYELKCSRMDLLSFTQSSFPIFLSTQFTFLLKSLANLEWREVLRVVDMCTASVPK